LFSRLYYGSLALRPAALLALLVGADRTLIQPTRTFTSGLPTVWSPAPSPDITSVPTGKLALAGLAPARSSTSFTAPSGFLSLPNRLRRLPSPAHFRRRSPGHAAFTALEVLHSRPSTDRASLATSLSLIGLFTPVPPGDPASPPEVTRCSSIPCRPQTPCSGG
jgi:hypothetical protein